MLNKERTNVHVSLDNLAFNYRQLRKLAPEARFLGVVKADAYGHGAVMISKELESLGADYLAVCMLDEAAQIRKSGVRLPILILGYTPPKFAAYEADNDITQEVQSLEYAEALNSALEGSSLKLKVHIKLDTGMTRIGFTAYGNKKDQTFENILKVAVLPHLIVEGVFQHFCCSDETDSDSIAYTKQQYERFTYAINELHNAGLQFEIRHCANTGATIQYPEYAMDMIRPGIATYGYSPSKSLEGRVELRPLMSLHSTVVQIRDHQENIPVSYGRTWCSPKTSRIGVLSIGYADGLDRRLSNQLCVYHNGTAINQIGRICMDMCMIDLTDHPEISEGTTLTIFDQDHNLNDIANQLDTIPYELLCRISKRVPRIYSKDDETIAFFEYL